MSDDVAATNRARWNAPVDANVEYTQPMLALTANSALDFVDHLRIMGDVSGKRVLCLASGGGQQSVAFALLGADVTVFDLSDRQLERDRLAASHYGLTIRTVQGDMRHLDAFGAQSFDLVFQAYSINFVPKVEPVITEVARLLCPGALYRIEWHNPFVQVTDPDQDWNGSGYLLRHEYVDGRETTQLYPLWSIDQVDGSKRFLDSPRAFVHSLSTMMNALAANGFAILHAAEYTGDGREAAPGSWYHYLRVAPPYLTLWSRYVPQLLNSESWR